MPESYTPRGFAIYKDIETSYGGSIRVQESSNVIPSVWLFIAESVQSGEFDQHLNVYQAKELRNALNEFLEVYDGYDK
jgi:hypothetical protein